MLDKREMYGFLAPIERFKRGNATEKVERALRQAVVGLDFDPGEFIDKAAVCSRLGVSRFPVSEALGRLATDGLVEILPQRGTRAARVRLAAARPNLVLVGLGVPKQELLADRLRPYVAGPVLCCGATIPVLAGAVRRAPAPVRRFGVEWAYRIGQSPVRMAPRYVRTGSWFFWTLAREMTLRLGRSRTRLPEQ